MLSQLLSSGVCSQTASLDGFLFLFLSAPTLTKNSCDTSPQKRDQHTPPSSFSQKRSHAEIPLAVSHVDITKSVNAALRSEGPAFVSATLAEPLIWSLWQCCTSKISLSYIMKRCSNNSFQSCQKGRKQVPRRWEDDPPQPSAMHFRGSLCHRLLRTNAIRAKICKLCKLYQTDFFPLFSLLQLYDASLQ